ncbi:hypothetical protein B1813_19050 [Saccharomonospora piscinae]|uniref:Uncharacterized protein n=1 Tax=Saccharomonospora piscinae TaxID=687388 RepID=A0A1V8ZYD7_SACPI|nr:hypothetical protein [Saccharomonospora piscinae]OQO89939.1 hypothetical protein B1813_19050 [Saccharomonospora piscinae]
MPLYAGQIIRAKDLVPTDFLPVTFVGDWHNFGSGWTDCQFRYDPVRDQVEVKGTVDGRKPDGTDTVGSSSHMFTLPEGYRPSASAAVAAGHVSTPYTSSVQVRFYSSGEVWVHGADQLNTPVVVIDNVAVNVS